MIILKRWALLLSLGATQLVGCGESEISLAEKATLKVQFAQKLVQVQFLMNPDFRLTEEKSIDFEVLERRLSRVFLKKDLSTTSGSRMNLGVIYAAGQLPMDIWPTEELTAFPNFLRLPKTVPSGSLQIWKHEKESLAVATIHQSDPHLIIGGALLSSEFDFLPLGFVGHQYFRDAGGRVEASLSLIGPNLQMKGGLYFLGNFGLNPFVVLRDKPASEGLSMDLIADGPMEIVDPGERELSISSLWGLRDRMRRFQNQLLKF